MAAPGTVLLGVPKAKTQLSFSLQYSGPKAKICEIRLQNHQRKMKNSIKMLPFFILQICFTILASGTIAQRDPCAPIDKAFTDPDSEKPVIIFDSIIK